MEKKEEAEEGRQPGEQATEPLAALASLMWIR